MMRFCYCGRTFTTLWLGMPKVEHLMMNHSRTSPGAVAGICPGCNGQTSNLLDCPRCLLIAEGVQRAEQERLQQQRLHVLELPQGEPSTEGEPVTLAGQERIGISATAMMSRLRLWQGLCAVLALLSVLLLALLLRPRAQAVPATKTALIKRARPRRALQSAPKPATPLPRIVFVRGAGDKSYDGTYQRSGQTQNGLPVFRKGSGDVARYIQAFGSSNTYIWAMVPGLSREGNGTESYITILGTPSLAGRWSLGSEGMAPAPMVIPLKEGGSGSLHPSKRPR